MPKWSEKINNLSDDTILICSGHKSSIRKMMGVLNKYERVSGHLINLNKSFVYLHEKIPTIMKNKIRMWTEIGIGSFNNW